MSQRRQETFIHLVWSTWDRAPMLGVEARQLVWGTIARTAWDLGCTWVGVGGIEDHVHVLCAIPTTLPVAELAHRLKGVSARATNLRAPNSLRWQGGYGAFSVSPHEVSTVEAYIRNQELHHRSGSSDPAWE
jgi:REP element-mobilizing transposase RayT